MSDKTRRYALGALALGLLGVATTRAGWLQGLLPARALAFEPMDSPAGYRFLKTGPVSLGGGVPLFGLDGAPDTGLIEAREAVAQDLPGALFEPADGAVPIAYFFDYQCPICRRLSPRLLALEGVSISWHDLASLGKASETAARAAIAARAQGAYDAFHKRLMRARFQATDAYVATLSDSIGIDRAQFLADMNSPQTLARMWQSRALADVFGMAGTPGLVIGKSVIVGDISTRDLMTVIEQERREKV